MRHLDSEIFLSHLGWFHARRLVFHFAMRSNPGSFLLGPCWSRLGQTPDTRLSAEVPGTEVNEGHRGPGARF